MGHSGNGRLAGAILAACLLVSACQSLGGDGNKDVWSIINRPVREAEEAAAWNPDPKPEPLDALLNPPAPLKDSYPTRAMEIPWRWSAAPLYWMDNRYALTTVWPPDYDQSRARILLVDSATGKSHLYKVGALGCYRPKTVIYTTGPSPVSAVMKPDARMWMGPLGQEKEISAYEQLQKGGFRPTMVNSPTCTIASEETAAAIEAENASIGGTFIRSPNSDPEAIWRRTGLRKEHGGFYLNVRDLDKMPWAQRDSRIGVHWRQPSGEWRVLPLNDFYELQTSDRSTWVPWLGRYVFAGVGITYSEAREYVTLSRTPAFHRYGKVGNVVIFDPATGEIVKVPRPKYLLQHVQLRTAHPTRAGILWQSGIKRPWGLYLSRGEEVRQVSERHVNRVTMSPNGCRAALEYYPSRGDVGITKIEFIDFCEAHS